MKERRNKILNGASVCRAVALFLFVIHLFPLFPVFFASACEAKEELLLSSFSTRYDESNEPRSKNIRLACRFLDGVRLGGGETFSFNEVVGERTRERGFFEATVIVKGEFVVGVGGGVCQVSTTVYNGALIAGMGITEVHAHSLKVGYVEPSFDAMVSSFCDLKFVNPGRTPIVLSVDAAAGVLTVRFYGRSDGFTYRTESRTVGVVPQPQPKVVEGETEAVLREGRDGIRSEGYLLKMRRGRVKKTERIRRDVYAPVQAVEQRRFFNENGEIFDNKFEENTQNN